MVRPVKVLVVLAVCAGMLVLTPQASWACSCAMMSTAQKVHGAGTIVDGTLDWEATNGITTTYSVVVSKVYKGKAAEREKVVGSANEASCGLGSLATDERYLFFVEGRHPGKLTASLCGGTTRYDAALAAQIQRVTGEEPTGPFATPGSRPGAVDEDPIAGTAWYTALGTGAVLAAVLGALVLFRRRTAR